MLMLNWISSACNVQAGQAGPLYVKTTISMGKTQVEVSRWVKVSKYSQVLALLTQFFS